MALNPKTIVTTKDVNKMSVNFPTTVNPSMAQPREEIAWLLYFLPPVIIFLDFQRNKISSNNSY